MKHLHQLARKCRHEPKMGGNTETITMPCTLVSRLIGLATHAIQMDQCDFVTREAVWLDDETKAYLEAAASPTTTTPVLPTP